MFRSAFLSFVILSLFADFVISEYNLTIVHLTDFHSHWFEFNANEKKCSIEESKAGKCYGGFPRLVSLVNDIRSKDQNVVVLSSGEFFLGRSLNAIHGWKLANAFLPYLNIDAMSLANHDFSSGMYELSAYLYGMKFPVLCANMWARDTSFMNSRVNKSAVLNIGGEKIGIVGYLHPETLEKSRKAVSVRFSPEIPAIRKEVKRLESEGVNKIIALGHSGYSTDLEISKKVKEVDVVIGGNSDIILDERIEASAVGNIHGNYPRVHHHENEIDTGEIVKNKTLVLHIPQHGKYVGKIKVTFDDDGKIINEAGEAVLLDNKIKQDKRILKLLKDASKSLEKIAEHSHLPDDQENLAFATADFESRGCRIQECTLGNLVTDAMLQVFNDQEEEKSNKEWKPVDAIIFNSGAMRYPLLTGPITIKDLLHSLFAGDFMTRVKLPGQQLRKLFEHSVKRYDIHGVDNPGSFLQVSGLKVTFALNRKPGNRVQTILVQRNGSFEDIKPEKIYIVGMPDFIVNGGDGYPELKNKNADDHGNLEVLLLVNYLRVMGRVTPKLDERITLLGKFPSKENITQSIENEIWIPVNSVTENFKHSTKNNIGDEEKILVKDLLHGLNKPFASSVINNSTNNSDSPAKNKISTIVASFPVKKDENVKGSTESLVHLNFIPTDRVRIVTVGDINNTESNFDGQIDNVKNSTSSRATMPSTLKENIEDTSVDENFLSSSTTSESVSKSINSTIKALVKAILPTLNSSTLQTLSINSDAWKKELDNNLGKKITVTTLSPSEVTTLASNISFKTKVLGSVFSSILQELRNETKTKTSKSSTTVKPFNLPQTIFLSNETVVTTQNGYQKESNGQPHRTLNDSVLLVEDINGLQDLIINSVISSLIDTIQGKNTTTHSEQERSVTTELAHTTPEKAGIEPKTSTSNPVDASSLSPNARYLQTLFGVPTTNEQLNSRFSESIEKHLEEEKNEIIGSSVEDLEKKKKDGWFGWAFTL